MLQRSPFTKDVAAELRSLLDGVARRVDLVPEPYRSRVRAMLAQAELLLAAEKPTQEMHTELLRLGALMYSRRVYLCAISGTGSAVSAARAEIVAQATHDVTRAVGSAKEEGDVSILTQGVRDLLDSLPPV